MGIKCRVVLWLRTHLTDESREAYKRNQSGATVVAERLLSNRPAGPAVLNPAVSYIPPTLRRCIQGHSSRDHFGTAPVAVMGLLLAADTLR